MKNIVLFILWLSSPILIAQPTYSTYTNNTGEVLYRYEDGYTITKADYDESERLRRSADDKYRSKDYISAIRVAESALAKNKKNVYAWFKCGNAKRQKGDYDGAISDYTEAIRLNPSDPDAWYNRGYNKRQKGDNDGAISDYTEAIRLNPNDSDIWNNRGVAKDDKGDYKGAISDYTEAIRLNPVDSDIWNNRGATKDEIGDYDGAISDYTEAIRLAPDDSDVWSNLGITREQKGQLEEARNDFKKALEIDPANTVAQNNLKGIEDKLAVLRPKRTPTVQLVAVGIGTYQADYAFNDLEFTVPGAYTLRNLFERRNLTANAKPLCNSDARRKSILSALEALTDPKNVQEDDLVIFYFSGHGLMAGGKVGICPWDYQSSADLISDNDITSILNRCPARHKVCLIEACKNETSADYMTPSAVVEFNNKRRNISAGIAFITSTEVGKKSWGVRSEGFFTHAVIEGLDKGLADTNGDHEITVLELFNYIQPAVKKRTNNQQVPQINSGYPKNLPIMKY
ncbi:MAG: tetratricopeptide repeat protein [Lewinellaceae bacterium]|nr:tetratricopeptide repeat protein [Saprospiraceae bacterium]MCB9343034.1 tetratricopeptide repeat protein [Lewinellaceae bacterium]